MSPFYSTCIVAFTKTSLEFGHDLCLPVMVSFIFICASCCQFMVQSRNNMSKFLVCYFWHCLPLREGEITLRAIQANWQTGHQKLPRPYGFNDNSRPHFEQSVPASQFNSLLWFSPGLQKVVCVCQLIQK